MQIIILCIILLLLDQSNLFSSNKLSPFFLVENMAEHVQHGDSSYLEYIAGSILFLWNTHFRNENHR